MGTVRRRHRPSVTWITDINPARNTGGLDPLHRANSRRR